tara:strand:- start:199 stop:1176 length:978 start_codon:yes stop_codon:yes gene_type:complete
MSNFSTFFPAGGGGEGSGINSYAPFSVVSDNNPQGYIESTGVYTNPVDDSVWLKTGKFLSTSLASTYPNATIAIVPDAATAPVQFTRSRGFAANATHVYATNYSNTNIYKFDITTGTALSASSVPSSTQSTGVALTSNRVYVYAHIGGGVYVIEVFDLNLVNIPGEKITGLPAYQQWRTFVKSGTSWFVIGTNLKSVLEYNSDFTSVLNTYNVAIGGSSTATLYTIAYDGTSFWLTSQGLGTNRAYQYNTSFVATGASFEMTVIQSPANTLSWVGYNAGNSKYFALSQDTASPFETYYQQYESVIGDDARTDSSGSGQPLFIKLK